MKIRWFSASLSACLAATLTLTSWSGFATAKEKLSVRYHPIYKTASFIKENWSSSRRTIAPNELIWDYLNARKNLFKIADQVQDHFQLESKNTDNLGMSHYRLQQVHLGVPVYGSEQTVHFNRANTVTSYMGQVIPNIKLPAFKHIKHISVPTAISIAKKQTKHVKQYLYQPTSQLVVFPYHKSFAYAYVIKLAYLSPQPTIWQYFIDAKSGKILQKINILNEIAGNGKGVKGDKKTFEITKDGNLYYLKDQIRNISTYDAKHEDENSPVITGKLVSSKTKNFSDPSSVDAHAYAEATYDFYKKSFGRNSFDGKGSAIKSYVHVGDKWNNAAWDGEKMIYGDGDGKTFISLAGGLDVVAHELTHAVTQYTANLEYQGESGALNESISDIMGVMVDSDDWLLGEDIYTPNKPGDALRSMADPTKYNQPDNYDDRYLGWQDNGGVHINSGINNKAAYLIAAGGTHYDVKVVGIGRAKTKAIYYRALTNYLTPSSQFIDMRDAAIQSATDLYGANSKEVTSVSKAYDAVGVVE
ncbi:M4 family metallopeptidase [Shimazuella sp. AN120528]|uniref:M4 family metallopeptidase n=1 Tax=Shimazuella soli TaxID=1892854 RepID=UPI001F1168A4|nr:M4 family metallopeptidase [Shimazuella soli]MCH5585545.1 M4 family metallopeptidase [Shimazuella soli]